jgi:hypothetical protein
VIGADPNAVLLLRAARVLEPLLNDLAFLGGCATGYKLRVITAPYFLATKLEAFYGRGKGDYAASHDLEDVLSVIDGRPELIEEVRHSDVALRLYLAEQFRLLMRKPRFLDAIPGHLLPDAASQARRGIVMERIEELAAK